MRFKALASVILFLFAWLALANPPAGSTAVIPAGAAQQRRARSTRRRGVPRVNQPPRTDFRKFSHRTLAHQQECSACHKFPSSNWKEVRKGTDAFADVTEFPQHSSCLKCHTQQFFARERPAPRICSVCHLAITPRYTERHPFPNPPEVFNASKKAQDFVSDFRIHFPHDSHLELVGRNQTPYITNDSLRFQRALFIRGKANDDADKSCAFCHQTYQPQGKSNDEFVTPKPKSVPEDAFWLKKGSFKTLPNHATCFTCHAAEGDMKPGSNECAVCHKLAGASPRADFDFQRAKGMAITDGNILIRWRRRHSSGTFDHDGEMHREQGCITCHKVSAMNTVDEASTKVPIVACDACHIGASADEGALNFEIDKRKTDKSFECTKCHITFGKEPIPESHINALPKPPAK